MARVYCEMTPEMRSGLGNIKRLRWKRLTSRLSRNWRLLYTASKTHDLVLPKLIDNTET